jgi:hypothetical protein
LFASARTYHGTVMIEPYIKQGGNPYRLFRTYIKGHPPICTQAKEIRSRGGM